MKKSIAFIIVIIAVVTTSCEEKIDIEKEKEAIKTAIENDLNAFLSRDFTAQSKFYIQDESVMLLTSGEDGYGAGHGWKEVSEGFIRFYEAMPNPSTQICKLTNYKINVYKESAWASYDENWYESENEFIWKNTNVKILIKENGEWKIVFLSTVYNTPVE